MHDRFIPQPDNRSRHTVIVDVAPGEVWPYVRHVDLSASKINRALFAARGLGRTNRGTDLIDFGFVVLADEPTRYLALGLIAKPWLPKERPVRIEDRDRWIGFEEPGYAKISWTFALKPVATGTEVSTETRITCTDDVSRRRFKRYWRLVGPFSGLTRREILKSIKHRSESSE